MLAPVEVPNSQKFNFVAFMIHNVYESIVQLRHNSPTLQHLMLLKDYFNNKLANVSFIHVSVIQLNCYVRFLHVHVIRHGSNFFPPIIHRKSLPVVLINTQISAKGIY